MDTVAYRTVTEWLAEELAFSRGGSTLTTPFTGLYASTTEKTLTHDRIQILFCDFDLDSDDLGDRAELLPGVRSFHIRYARSEALEYKVKNPVHVLYYRVVRPGLIEIVGVLHERMEPSRHLRIVSGDKD